MNEKNIDQKILQMFDMEEFRTNGHTIIDLLAKHIQNNIRGHSKVLNWQEPEQADLNWNEPLPEESTIDIKEFIKQLENNILEGSLAIHHPHNLGHQVATPIPIAALCDLVASLTNQAMAVYETGPSATMLERQVIRWLSQLIGWMNAEGVLTSGGALANLTALLAARQQKSDIWKTGKDDRKLCILASEHSHYSISRAAGIMGLGTDSVITIKTDIQGKMDVNDLKQAHKTCVNNKQTIIAVVATAGCTPTGSIDPLLEIGHYCNSNDIWLHVDGAHGASALLSSSHRDKLRGIELADSVVWDGHKLLYMPAAVSAVIFRDAKASFSAFSQDASYLFQGESNESELFNVSYRTLECTKKMMGLKLWATFSLFGLEGLGLLVDKSFENARLFAAMLSKHPQFSVLMEPQTNIVCFRHMPKGLAYEKLNDHQLGLRKRIIESGEFHLTQVKLHDRIWLRTTLMNPFTTQDHLSSLIKTIFCDLQDH